VNGQARWHVGGLTITKIEEMVAPSTLSWLIPAAADVAAEPSLGWIDPRHLGPAAGQIPLSYAGFLIESDTERVLVDTGIGPEHSRGPGAGSPFVTNLRRAGYPPESIDTVICTHIHVDHIGWNTTVENGHRRPTFPSARYVFCEKEWDWASSGADMTSPLFASVGRDVRFIVDAGLADLVDGGHRVNGNVGLLATHGHSPGHVSVLAESNGEQAIITGDALHHPLQLTKPTWGAAGDADPARAAASRTDLIDRVADTGTLLIGTHFAEPAAGYVRRTDGRAQFVPIAAGESVP
jgi:glyoxylase-like metal-dependent hydrolase (beta-lactamase superfamily II)